MRAGVRRARRPGAGATTPVRRASVFEPFSNAATSLSTAAALPSRLKMPSVVHAAQASQCTHASTARGTGFVCASHVAT